MGETALTIVNHLMLQGELVSGGESKLKTRIPRLWQKGIVSQLPKAPPSLTKVEKRPHFLGGKNVKGGALGKLCQKEPHPKIEPLDLF